jgi:3-oxoadipate enol-lactonase
MPYAWNKRTRIYWEEEGQGDPLLMIMGLGFSMAMWRNLRPVLAQHFHIILLDNRGVGRSDVPLLPFSMATMARDAACVMDAAGFRSAHVLGMSMGGMIAQELALNFPDRVRKLVLACTNCGRSKSVHPDPKVLRVLAPRPFESRAARLEKLIPYIYDSHTPRERIDADLAVVRKNMPPLRGYLEQAAAIAAWDSYYRLPGIKNPTLVIHGVTDRLVPAANARILANRIPCAKLVLLPDASHIFPTDQPELARKELLAFLCAPVKA